MATSCPSNVNGKALSRSYNCTIDALARQETTLHPAPQSEKDARGDGSAQFGPHVLCYSAQQKYLYIP